MRCRRGFGRQSFIRTLKYWDRALEELTNSDRTLKDIFAVSFGFSDNVFLEWTCSGRICRMTYAECRICIEQVAGDIAGALSGAPKNAFVGLLLDNSPEWVVAFWAILQAGFRPLLLNPRADDEQNRYLLKNARAVALAAKRPLGDAIFLDSADMARPPIVRRAFAPCWADGIALCFRYVRPAEAVRV